MASHSDERTDSAYFRTKLRITYARFAVTASRPCNIQHLLLHRVEITADIPPPSPHPLPQVQAGGQTNEI